MVNIERGFSVEQLMRLCPVSLQWKQSCRAPFQYKCIGVLKTVSNKINLRECSATSGNLDELEKANAFGVSNVMFGWDISRKSKSFLHSSSSVSRSVANDRSLSPGHDPE
jgi:hypothetical protein